MKRICMKKSFLLALVAVIVVVFLSCSSDGDSANENLAQKSTSVELSIQNETSYDLTDVSWRGIAFYSSVDGKTLPSSSVAKNNVEEDVGGYVFFTRCGIVPAKLRTQKFVISPDKFTFTDYTPVVEVGNIGNTGTLSNIILSAPDYYIVSFESNGGSYIEPYTVQRGKEISVAPEVKKDGVAFAGWYLDKDFKQKIEFPYMPDSDTGLYAEWKSSPQPVPFTGTRDSSIITIQITPSDDKYFDCYHIVCYQVFGTLVTSRTLNRGHVKTRELVKDVTTRDLSYEFHGVDGKYYSVELYVVDTFGQQSENYSKSF